MSGSLRITQRYNLEELTVFIHGRVPQIQQSNHVNLYYFNVTLHRTYDYVLWTLPTAPISFADRYDSGDVSISGMTNDECGAVGGMRIGRGNRSIRRKLPQYHFVRHKSHITLPELEPGPPS
jgi:hypothetical protein